MILFTFKNVLSLIKPLGKSIPKAVMLLGAIALLCSSVAYAQSRRVTGLVTDIGTGETLIGATVAVKGSPAVTQVDVAGKFALDVPANAVLIVRYVGYTDLEVPVGGQTTLDIKLAKVTKDLEEVVITGFGLTTKKATLSGAVSSIGADDIARSRATSAAGALIGKIAGITFRQTDGRPGSTPSLNIRNFGGAPLYVIDGITRNADAFNNLDFNDIESVNILKDATASIYGMLAENGVVVVTTKKGKRGQKPTIGFDMYYGIQQVANFNKPADIKSYIKGIVQTETYGDGINSYTRTITPAEYDKWMAGTEPGYQGFDWYKYIYKNAPQSQYRLNVSGGSDNADYYVAGSTTAQSPMLRDMGLGFRRHNIQANINATISKRVKFGVAINGYWSKNSSTNVPGDNYDFAAETAYRNLPTASGPYANNNSLYPQNTSQADWTYSYGLVNERFSGVESSITRNIQINGNLEISILEGLKARFQAAYATVGSQFDSRRLSNQVYKYDAATSAYTVDLSSENRNMDRSFGTSDNTTLQGQLDYKKSFGKHNFNAIVGFEKRLNYSPSLRVQGNPPANNIPFTPNVPAFWVNVNDNISLYTPRLGYLTRLSYDYAGKYIAEFQARYDGSTAYPVGRQYGFFPGGSVAYRISQEDFWKKSSFLSKINDFKIKASYGTTGFEEGANGYFTGYDYNSGGQAVINGQPVLGTQARGLPSSLTWGRSYQSNISVEFTTMNNRLGVELTYFNRTRTGIQASRGLNEPSYLTGFSLPNDNLNTNKNRGFEVSASWRDRIGEVAYNIGGNITYGRSITGFRWNYLPSSEYSRWRNPGSDVDRLNGGPFQLTANGQFQSWEEIKNYPIDQDGVGNRTLRPGDFKYVDSNGDGFITDEDRKITTYQVNGGNPPLTFGLNFGANYKGFNISFDFAGGSMFTFEQDGYMRNWVQNQNTSQYLMDNSSYYSNIWDRNSPIVVGKFPLLVQSTTILGSQLSHSGWQTNLTYAKLRNIEIGYTIPYSVLKPLGISNLKVYVSGQNVLVISNMPNHLDPEINSSGGNAMPNPRILTAGVQVKF